MTPTPWQRQNLEEIKARLAGVSAKADGLICARKTPLHHAVVLKEGPEIQLYLVDTSTDPEHPRVRGVMSRLDLERPLKLSSIYAQAMLLSMIWSPQPRRVLVLGFGGGRIPLVLHHCLPEAVIESVEIDPVVVELAQAYFGIQLDERMQVFVREAQDHLAQAEATRYDLILIDCFTGVRHTPHHLATREFYELCKRRLNHAGVLATYWIESDPLLPEKIQAFRAAFATAARFEQEGAHVLIGSTVPRAAPSEWSQEAARLRGQLLDLIPVMERASQFQPLDS